MKKKSLFIVVAFYMAAIMHVPTSFADTAFKRNPAVVNEPADKPINIHRLPSAVKPFVESKFPGYRIKSAASDPLCDGSPAIDVVIVKKGSAQFSLIFKNDGTFVQKEEDAPLTTAPEKVREAFKKQFAGYSAAKAIEKLTLADGTIQYLLDISKAGKAKEAIFSIDGTLICLT